MGPQRAELFARLGVRRVVDLLFYFPRDYLEPVAPQAYGDLKHGERGSVVGTVDVVESRYLPDGRSVVGVLLKLDGGGFVRLTWFNQAFRGSAMQRGERYRATGVLKSTGISYQIRHPEVLKLDPDDEPPVDRPRPVYPLTEGLQQRHVASAAVAAAEQFADAIEDAFTPAMLAEHDLLPIARAIREIHSPESIEAANRARDRFVFQELLVYQLALAMRRSKLLSRQAAPSISNTASIHHRVLRRIGLQLTGDQERAIAEICGDMQRPVAMNRLLQGDVGSGKTAVALYAMLLAVANGYQATFMAPTEILARQHYERIRDSLRNSDCEVALLVGSLSQGEKEDLQHRIALGTVDIVVGTQALLSGKVGFERLGLAVIDEQHKFGVAQRASLRGAEYQPHYLVLSATPIPRTLTMTAFGDLDVSVLREKPPGREPVHTYLAAPEQADRWWDFVRKKVAEGRQAFVIAPRVTADESNEVTGAEQTYESLRSGALAGLRVGLLHGRMDPDEKNQSLADFAEGRIDVLVATTVVEVGIDVPNASVMTILDANRLGLAQLHQLRGRIGRGAHRGYLCVFASAGVDAEEQEKLVAFSKTDDGFELAEMDMRIRGPGNLLGTQQSGLPPFRIANLDRDREVVEKVRTVARGIIAADPGLDRPEHARLKTQVTRRHGGMIDFGDVG